MRSLEGSVAPRTTTRLRRDVSPGLDRHVASGHAEDLRQEAHELGICRTFHRTGRETDPQRVAVQSRDSGPRGAGLDAKLEYQPVVLEAVPAQARPATVKRTYASGIRITCNNTISTSGVRSMFATGGTMRLSGRRNGRVTASNIGPTGE